MRSILAGRATPLALAVSTALACAGCPELNTYPDRTNNAQFSVDDPTGRTAAAQTVDGSAPVLDRTQFMISEDGKLSNQPR